MHRTKKYTYNEVQKIFSDGGCRLLSKIYVNVTDPLRYECSCGNESYITLHSFKAGHRCSICAANKRRKFFGFTLEKVKGIFKQEGCKLLSKTYINSTGRLKFLCSCGNISYTTLCNFRRGNRCRRCGARKTSKKLKLSLKDVRKIFSDGGCTLLSKKYKNNHELLDYICKCNEVSKISLMAFRIGQRCKKCGFKKNSGVRNAKYNPNLTDEDRLDNRTTLKNKAWIRRVMKRDNHTCQCCGATLTYLNAHHVYSYHDNKDLRFKKNNGVTLCKTCHKLFHDEYGRGNNTLEQLEEFLFEYSYDCDREYATYNYGFV